MDDPQPRHYRIKQTPEDFKVIEKPKIILDPTGRYSYFILKKTGYNTIQAIQTISRILGIDTKRIGFAGNKDKHAVTEQAISINDMPKERIEGIKIAGIELKFIGYGNNPLRLADLEGNYFEIIVREIEAQPKKISRFVNYYGEQRFGTDNPAIGKSLVKRDYQGAINAIISTQNLENKQISEFLQKNPNNPIGAMRLIPRTLLMMYVHAYQSELWNETVRRYIESKGQSEKVPLIGFGMEISDPILDGIIGEIMSREEITPRDFVFRDFPELCSEGGERNVYGRSVGLFVGELDKNELGPGSKVLIKFELDKGSYATVLIEQMFLVKK